MSKEEKWCIYFRYRHEERAAKLIKELSRKEEGIMWAERAASKVDRDRDKALKRMIAIKRSMDEAQYKSDLREQVIAELREEVRDEVSQEVRDEVREEVSQEVRDELREEVRDEVSQEVRDEVSQERTLEIARKMKKAGRPLSEIEEFTGLPKKTVEAM